MNAITFSAGELVVYIGLFLATLSGTIAILFRALIAAKDQTIAEACKERDEWRNLCLDHVQLSSRSMEVARTVTSP